MKQRKMNILGQEMDVTEVDIVEKKDRPAELKLEDGSIISFIAVPVQVIRLEGQYNADGTPIYLVTNGVVVNPIYVPDELKKRS